jgi:DNA primase
MALYRAGFTNAVATCGTALTEEHGRLLQRYAKKVLLLFDQDKAGLKATFRAMDVLLPLGLSVAVVGLDPGEDPDSFVLKQGVEVFAERLQQVRPVLEVYMDAELAAHGDSIEGRARAAEEIVGRLKLVPSEIERSLYLQSLARRTGLELNLLQQKSARPAVAPVTGTTVLPQRPAASSPVPQRRLAPVMSKEGKAQELLLRLMLEDPKVRAEVAEAGVPSLFFNPDRQAIAEQILVCAANGEDIAEVELFDRLNEEQKAILSGILVKDEKAFAEERQRIVQDCRQTVLKETLKRRVRDLDEQICRAEQSGDLQQLAACQVERLNVCRELKK